MSNPLERFLQPQSANPLDQFLGESGVGTDTAIGRLSLEQGTIQDNIAKLKKQRESATDPAVQERLDRLIASLEKQSFGITRPVTHTQEGPDPRTISGAAQFFGPTKVAKNLASGVMAGPVRMGEFLAT